MNAADHRSKPDNWVAGVQYTSHPVYTPAVTPDLQKKLHTPTAATALWAKLGEDAVKAPCPNAQIRPVVQQGHPANGQHGLFATKHIPPSGFIIPYIGLVHTNDPADTDAESNYDLAMDRELGVSVDASRIGNEARFINDYRGIAPSPNAEFQDCWVQMPAIEGRRPRWERRVGVFVLGAGKAGKRSRGIQQGQEILVNYGRSFWKERIGDGVGDNRPDTTDYNGK